MYTYNTQLSSFISCFKYCRNCKVLQIFFKEGKSIIEYYGIEPEVANGLFKTQSRGKFYNANIKGKYESKKYIDLIPAHKCNGNKPIDIPEMKFTYNEVMDILNAVKNVDNNPALKKFELMFTNYALIKLN